MSEPTRPPLLSPPLEVLSDAALFIGADGRVVACNRIAHALFGYEPGELAGLAVAALASRIVPESGDDWTRGPTGAATTGPTRATVIRRTGERVEVALSTARQGAEHAEAGYWLVLRNVDAEARLRTVTAELAESEEMLAALSGAAFEAVLVHRDGIILLANRAAEAAAGVAPGELLGRALFDFIAPEAHALARSKIAAQDEVPYEALGRRADGSNYPAEVRVRNTPVHFGGSSARVVALRDLSARKQLEEQFRQAQKMEAVGRLAGGVAHDFNNLLSVILNATEFALDELPPGHPSTNELREVTLAAQRAAQLTRQLLAFSRKQVLRPQVVEPSAVVRGMESMVRRLIGEDVELLVKTPSVGTVRADPSQLELIVMNLAVNARHAMPDGGRLMLVVEDVVLDAGHAQLHFDAAPGPHVMLTVADTGIGMDSATAAHIFEPFFTTKEQGKGTGLGLSTVFGIVKQSGGSISVESELGRGATFKICLPQCDDPATQEAPVEHATNAARSRKTVLVVEDEAPLRRLVVMQLESAGYEVLESADPTGALQAARAHAGPIDLLLTDVTMPGMNGKQLAERLSDDRPGLRVLYVSGYTDDTIVRHGLLDAGVHFVSKPFTRDGLLQSVIRVFE